MRILPSILFVSTISFLLSSPDFKGADARQELSHPSTKTHETSRWHEYEVARRAVRKSAPPDNFFFVVAATDFSESCGGCTVLHRLCDRLNCLFEDARKVPLCYLSPLDKTLKRDLILNPEYKTPLLPGWLDVKDGVVIYPEITHGNPFNATRIVNWILYFPGHHGGPSADAYDTRNMIACFSPGFCRAFNSSLYEIAHLRVLDYQLSNFLNLPVISQRENIINFRAKDTFYSSGHGTIIRNDTFPEKGETLATSTGKRKRLEMFARAEKFYSLDAATFRSVEAAMTGAISIVIPVEGISKQEWLETVGDEMTYGVAYGIDDISHARATQHLVMPHLRRLTDAEDRQVRTFVHKAYSFFEQKPKQ